MIDPSGYYACEAMRNFCKNVEYNPWNNQLMYVFLLSSSVKQMNLILRLSVKQMHARKRNKNICSIKMYLWHFDV